MICHFVLTGEKTGWICTRCGRRAAYHKREEFSPSAKCRIPTHYEKTQYIDNQKILGVGDFMARIFKQMGYKYRAVSTARAKINKLNSLGVEWCEKYQDVILLWVKEECEKKNIPFIPKPIKSIIKLAIRRAKTQTIEI